MKDYVYLQFFLPLFMGAYLCMVHLWNYYREKKSLMFKENMKNEKLRKTGKAFSVLSLIAYLIVLTYSFFPSLYNYFLPIDSLDIPLINSTGILLLKISFIVTAVIQATIDLRIRKIQLFQFYHAINMDKFYFISTKALYLAMTFMFIGLFVTISSIGAAFLVFISVLIFLFYFKGLNVLRSILMSF